MPQDYPRSDNNRAERSRSDKSSPGAGHAAFSGLGARDVAAGLRLQKEMFGLLSDIGQDWFARATAEAELALRLPNKLKDARSVPDAVTAYQQWFGEWINRCSEDSRRLFSNSEKIVDTGARCFTGRPAD